MRGHTETVLFFFPEFFWHTFAERPNAPVALQLTLTWQNTDLFNRH